MKKNMTRFYLIVAIVFIAFTVLAFAIPFGKSAAFWLSYVFGVIAIAVQLYTLPMAATDDSPKSKFYGFPIARISVLYLIAQLILSLIFMAVGKLAPTWIPAVLFVLLLCIAAVGFIAADAVREEVERQDVVLKENVAVMRDLQSRASTLADLCSDKEAKAAVTKFAEDLRFSDPVTIGTEDAERELAAELDNLQQAVAEGRTEEIQELCRKAGVTLLERNRQCKVNKRK